MDELCKKKKKKKTKQTKKKLYIGFGPKKGVP